MHNPSFGTTSVCVFGCALLFLAIAPAGAAVVLVPGDFGDLQSAINGASDGDTIELAAGTYNGTFMITGSNANKNLTIQAAAGADVNLTGNGAVPVLRYQKTAPNDSSIVFRNLDIVDGRSTTNAVAGGVTVTRGNATFIGCDFLDNVAEPSNTGGGGLFAFDTSVIHIFDSVFERNTSPNMGGGFRLAEGSEGYVHNSEFTANSTSVDGHDSGAAGGAVHMTNSELRIANSRFKDNKSGCVGGAVFVLGSPWVDPVSVPKGTARIINSTFINNETVPFPGESCGFTPVGGAVHSENQIELFVVNSRFEKNSAVTGGAITQYRSKMTVEDSVFRGNFATGTSNSQGFGGAIMSNSNDAVDETTEPGGATDRPSSVLTVRDSLFQGRYDGVTIASTNGGCIWAEGDANRTYGRFGVPVQGSAASNRSQITIERTIFADCDVALINNASGKGGAITVSHAALTLDDSLIFDSDADGGGGGLWALVEADVDISGTTFAYCSGDFGGAINAAGSRLEVDDSTFFGNETDIQGSAIWTAESDDTLTGLVDMDALGFVQNSTFSDNGDGSNRPDIYDRDKTGAGQPINRMTYSNNSFFDDGNGNIYQTNLSSAQDVAGLNSLVVSHPQNGVNIDKGSGNSALGSLPNLGALLAEPGAIIPVTAAGDTQTSTESFLGFAWSGSSATLDGTSLGANTAGLQADGAGVHTLSVSGTDFLAEITNGPEPNASFSASPPFINSPGSADLEWTTTAGAFVEMTIDRGVSATSSASGSETVSPSDTTEYQLCVLTREGGVRETTTVFVDEIPGQVFDDGFESGNVTGWDSSTGFVP